MADVEADRPGKPRQRVRYDSVESDRTQAAADYEDAHSPFPPEEAFGRRRQRNDVAADRIADGACLHAGSKAVGKRLEYLAREVSQTTIGEAGDRILLVDDERPAGEPCGDPARSGDETPESDDDRWPPPPHHPQRLHQRHREPPRCREQGAPALAAQAADRQPVDRNALGGNDTGLEPAA